MDYYYEELGNAVVYDMGISQEQQHPQIIHTRQFSGATPQYPSSHPHPLHESAPYPNAAQDPRNNRLTDNRQGAPGYAAHAQHTVGYVQPTNLPVQHAHQQLVAVNVAQQTQYEIWRRYAEDWGLEAAP